MYNVLKYDKFLKSSQILKNGMIYTKSVYYPPKVLKNIINKSVLSSFLLLTFSQKLT